MQSRKKVLALSMIAVLAAIAIISGSLAFFTDTDKATNVFVVGKNLSISQVEKERNDNGDLVDFTQNKILLPVTDDVPDNSTSNDLVEGVGNYVDKIVYVTNSSTTAAYVRTFIAVPKALVKDYQMLHFDSNKTNWSFDSTTYETTIDGVACVVYVATYANAVDSTAATDYVLKGVYLDKNVSVDDNGYLIYNDATGSHNSGFNASKINVYVATQAVQAEGFSSAAAALNEAFGAPSSTNLPAFN